ncbi:MAG: D-alanine--D-alanine ligase [Pseudomonadota bacterium]
MAAPEHGRVAVVMGGAGAEREVSLDGGRDVLAALVAAGVDARGVDGIPALLEQIAAGSVDRVFNLLHGRMGEDGTLQGALECLGVPVTGSGVLGSAASLDKALSKRVWRDCGLPTADFRVLGPADDAASAAAALGFPLVVKPVSEGSSVGVTIVRAPEGFAAAVAAARSCEDRILVEAFVAGAEYTVGLLQGEPLPVIRIEPNRDFYDYAAKYESDGTAYHCPSGLTAADEERLQSLALDAFAALCCEGWGRVDFLGAGSDVRLLEINTTPGMTSHSLVPKAAGAAGIGFEALCLRILETSHREARV